MKDPRLLLGLLSFIAFITVALAKEAVPNPHWFSSSDIKAIIAQEPAPPAAGSEAEKADMQKEVDAQKTRTPERIVEAKLDADYSVTLFTSVVGPKLTPQADPATFHFFEQLNRQIGEVVTDSKDHWKRLRPYLAHPLTIHPLFLAGGYSYPSGHSTHSYAFAIILGQIWPDKAAAFLHRADQIAESRVDAGVHYTSDIEEGKVVGNEIAKELLAKPEFQKELQAVEAEVAAQK